ncbi:tudor domain-containing protein 7 isoform X2 [Hyalella azteca]|uniref:Tudor domain-containing protein 7 isoform X2 n=1 Tax=Hyalella azteca TaxID=294128 RepID=A0A8B7N945_HYAAZ|nr:tudor domain-containing protein 7 isoform X2 [Hyalella azteca]
MSIQNCQNSKLTQNENLSNTFPTLSKELEEKRQNVLQLVRSLLNSAQGNLTIKELERDYQQMVDEPIPYRQLHHATLASFLQSAPEMVQLVNRSGVLYVQTAATARDHIHALVSGQKTVSKKKSKGSALRRPIPRSFPRQALLPHPPTAPIQNLPFQQAGARRGVYRGNSRGKGFGHHLRPHPQSLMANVTIRPENVNLNPPHREPIPQRQLIFQGSASMATVSGKLPTPPPSPLQLVQPLLPPSPQAKPMPVKSPKPPMLPKSPPYQNPAHNYQKKVESPTSPRMLNDSTSTDSILQDKKRAGGNTQEELEVLAKKLGYSNPEYTLLPMNKKWIATLKVNGKCYSSYPEERANAAEAKSIVAQKALAEIKLLMDLPLTGSFELCLERVKTLLQGEIHGLWFSHLCETYLKKFGENLPPDFCERANEREQQFANTGLAFTQHQKLWVLYKKNDANLERAAATNSLAHHSLPFLSMQQHSQTDTRQPSSLPNISQPLSPLQSGQKHQAQESSLNHQQQQKQHTNRPSLVRAVTMPVHPAKAAVAISSCPQTASEIRIKPHLNLSEHQLSLEASPKSHIDMRCSSNSSERVSKVSNEMAAKTLTKLETLSLKKNLVVNSDSDVGKSRQLFNTSPKTSITAVEDEGDSNHSHGSESSTPPALTRSTHHPPVMHLPDEDTWQVYVSHILDDCRICFRLIGDAYNCEYEELVTKMELHYFDKIHCTAPTSVELGHYYVLCHHETWFRVLVVGVTETTVSALLVDHGDTEEVAIENIYEISPEFLELPCQCVTATLSELEGVRCAPLTTALHTVVLGQTFSATVVARTPTVQVVLYNTSSSEKVNINEQLLQIVPESFTKPQLPQVGGIAEAFVTNVCDDGRVFVTVESETYSLLERMLAVARERAEELSGDSDVDLTKLYLARFTYDQDWHRVRVSSVIKKEQTDIVSAQCIDWGVSELVASHHLVLLSRVSPLLHVLPPQAMECTLANLPPPGLRWTQRASARLKELQPTSSPVLLKTVRVDPVTGVPEVLLFKRLLPQNELISINETLAIDSQLFSNYEENNNESQGSEGGMNSSSVLESAASSTSLSSLMSARGAVGKTQPPTPKIAPPCLPSVGETFDVHVTFAANPSNFAVHSVKEYNELEKLRREMQQHYTTHDDQGKVGVDEVVVGGYYAALHTDSYWYRVCVNSVMRDSELLCGVFVDFGDCFVLPSNCVRKLLPSFAKMPWQSIRASLYGVRPKSRDWIPEDACRFRDLVQGKEFVSFVMGISLDRGLTINDPGNMAETSAMPRLMLKLVDTSTYDSTDVYIDELLIAEGWGLPTPSAGSVAGVSTPLSPRPAV